jgi:uncharacterized protein (TIGR02246 family)
MGPDERAIREVHSIWIDAVNAGDLGRLLPLMAEDVVFLKPGRAPLGREGFSVVFPAAHQQARIHCISELEEVVVVGEVAYTRSADSLSVTPLAAEKRRNSPAIASRSIANSPTAAGSWPGMPTRCPRCRSEVVRRRDRRSGTSRIRCICDVLKLGRVGRVMPRRPAPSFPSPARSWRRRAGGGFRRRPRGKPGRCRPRGARRRRRCASGRRCPPGNCG